MSLMTKNKLYAILPCLINQQKFMTMPTESENAEAVKLIETEKQRYSGKLLTSLISLLFSKLLEFP